MADSKPPAMSSSKSYLVNALYQWIVDNHCTPYVLVDAYAANVEVPQDYVKDGQIVLNIAPSAIGDLLIDKKGVSFNARFGGIPMDIFAPMQSVLGIYARENGQGMMFEPEIESGPPTEPPKGPGPKLVSSKKTDTSNAEKPSLRVVK
ncbi:MAG: ClpXP protease specificity-enhancing factor [Pseudomonadales bacterium]|nr:ClpXP protease specificity-enhancing factor [Pseudomonadales bacterium]